MAQSAQQSEKQNLDGTRSGVRPATPSRHYLPDELGRMGSAELEKIIKNEPDLDAKFHYEDYRTNAKWNDLKDRVRASITGFFSKRKAQLAAVGLVAASGIVAHLGYSGYQQYRTSKLRNSHTAAPHTQVSRQSSPTVTTVLPRASVRVVGETVVSVAISTTTNVPPSSSEIRTSVSTGLTRKRDASVERGVVAWLRQAGNSVMSHFTGKKPENMARVIAQGANDAGLHIGRNYNAQVGLQCSTTVNDCSKVDVTLYNGQTVIGTRTVDIATARETLKRQAEAEAAKDRMVRRVLAMQPPIGQLFDISAPIMQSSPSSFPTGLPATQSQAPRSFSPASPNETARYAWHATNPNPRFTFTARANTPTTNTTATATPSTSEPIAVTAQPERQAGNRLLTADEISHIVSRLDGNPRVTSNSPNSLTITFRGQTGNDIELTFSNLQVTPTGAIAGSLPAQRDVITISSVLDGMLRAHNGAYTIAADIRSAAANLKWRISRLQIVQATNEQRQKLAHAREVEKALDILSAADKSRARK